MTKNRVEGQYYPRFFPEKVYLPCIKYRLNSTNPRDDGADELLYAESLHYHQKKETNEKVIITTGSEWLDSSRCSRMIDLYCDKENEKIFYNIKAGFDIFQTANFENTGVLRDGSKSHRRSQYHMTRT